LRKTEHLTPEVEKIMASQSFPDLAIIQRDIEQMIFRFFLHLDEQEYDQLSSLMASTGTWLRNKILLRGPADVREAMRSRPAGFTTRHLITNVIVDVADSDHADATYYMTVFVHSGEEKPTAAVKIDVPMHVSIYRQKVVRTPDGWRIAELSGTPTFHR
jgi:hypothetical protein